MKEIKLSGINRIWTDIRFRVAQRVLLGLALVFIALGAYAPGVFAYYLNSEYSATHYGTETDMTSIEVNTVAQDAKGYLWVGTYAGLYRFDGKVFEEMKLDERISSVMCLLVDGDQLWIGTNDAGLACYDLVQDSIVFYGTADGLDNNSVRALCKDHAGNLYIGTNGDINILTPEGELLNPHMGILSVRGMCLGEDDSICGITNAGLAFMLRDGQLAGDTSESDLDFYAVENLSAGGYLLGSGAGYLYDADWVQGRFRIRRFGTVSTPVGSINALKETSDGDIIICGTNGIGSLSSVNVFYPLSTDSFTNSVSCVIEDNQGNFWFGSAKQGILKLSKNPFRNLFALAGIESRAVNSVVEQDENLYVGCDDGLVILEGGDYSEIHNDLTAYFDGVRIRQIYRDSRNRLWFSTYGEMGLVCVAGEEMTSYTEAQNGTKGSRFRSVLELSDGTMVAASTTGITFLQEGVVVGTLGEEDGLTVPQILCLLEGKDGSVLAGSDGSGVFVIRNGKVEENIGEAQGLTSLVVMRIVPYGEGYVYVTGNGLFYQEGDRVSKLRRFPYSNVYDIIFGEDGNAWIPSSAGIFVVNAEELLDDHEYSVDLLNAERGLSNSAVANAWNQVDENGNLVLCTSAGVSILSVSEYRNTSYAFEANVKSLETDGNVIAPDENGIYQVGADISRIKINLAVLNFTLSNPMISCYLEGYDSTPVTMYQHDLEAMTYTGLPHGTYTFHLQLLDENGAVISEESCVIRKTAHIYQYNVFWVALSILVCVLLVLLTYMSGENRNLKNVKKQMEETRKAKEEAELANRYKDQFLSSMSHEIRTPINTILGMDELLLREDTSPLVRQYAEDIRSAGNSLLVIVEDVLDLSKLEAGQMKLVESEFDLAPFLNEVGQSMILRTLDKQLTPVFEIDPQLPARLYGDSIRLRQVLQNLITNAVKYTPNGSVTLKVELERIQGLNAYICFRVIDTGTGIRKEDQGRLLEKFERGSDVRDSKIGGSGLGLTICSGLLEMMESKLNLKSVYGEGSEFYFTVRQVVVSDSPVGELKIRHAMKDANGTESKVHIVAPDAKVLVVDDTPLNLAVVAGLLKINRIQADVAESGEAALKLLEKQKYHLIFMDHMMPGMDGIATMQAVREFCTINRDTPVVMLTANAVAGSREMYLELGFSDYVAKPVTGDRLEEMLSKYLPQNLVQQVDVEDLGSTMLVRYADMMDVNPLVGIENCANDQELYDSVLLMMVSEYDELKKQLLLHYGERDDKNFVTTIHRLKSSAKTIGALGLARVAQELENAGKGSDWTAVNMKLESFFRMYEKVVSEVRTCLEKNSNMLS